MPQTYTREVWELISHEKQTNMPPYRRMDITHSAEGWVQIDTDADGKETNRWRSIKSGNVEMVYFRGELATIISTDPASGCEILKNFHQGSLIEITNCDKVQKRALYLSTDETREDNCEIIGNHTKCTMFSNGELVQTFGYYRDADTVIEYYNEVSKIPALTQYFKAIKFNSADREETRYHKLIAPAGAPVPLPSDTRWEYSGTEIKAGKLSRKPYFSLITAYGPTGEVLTEQKHAFY